MSLWSYLADNMVRCTGLLYITYIDQMIYPARWPILCGGRSKTELSPAIGLLQEGSWAQTQSPGIFQKCTDNRNVDKVEWPQLCKVHRILSPNVPPGSEGTLLPSTSFPSCGAVMHGCSWRKDLSSCSTTAQHQLPAACMAKKGITLG